MKGSRAAEVEAIRPTINFAQTRYQVVLETSLGSITLDLLPEVAPGHCCNLIALAKIGFYDGVVFHRVIKDFVIQAGCPRGDGTGGPGYTIAAEFNATPHEAGVLSMARTNDPDSAGSQFFICLGRIPHLDRKYTVFGRTADAASLEVVQRIGSVKTGAGDRPTSPVVIKTAHVLEHPL